MEQKIDLVYLWVNGNDPKWLEKRNSFLGKNIQKSALTGRYEDNDELKYSLRSVEKHLPWVRNIFIVTDNQIPNFLDVSNPKIKIIDHTEIIPKEFLPTFNAGVIEYFLHNIPNLSEQFIFSNDDFFVNSPLSEDFFFKDGLPIIRMVSLKKFFIKLKLKKWLNRYVCTYHLGIMNALKLVENKYGKSYAIRPYHNIDAYLKSDYKKAYETFEEDIKPTLLNRFRKNNDIQRILFDAYALANNRGHLEYVKGRKLAYLILLEKANYQKRLSRYKPKLFCLNDTEDATDEDRKRVVPFLESLFPTKSKFEK